MARTKRRCYPGVLYHVISRFVDREWFISEPVERQRYITLLGQAVTKSDWRCLAYAVMSNHIHLAVIAGEEKLDRWVRAVHAPFADWLNKRHDRIGNIFTRGPKSIPIPHDRAPNLLAYIHNNPVRANVVDDPAKSNWTSHRAYLGLASAPPWLHIDEGLALASFTSRTAFAEWTANNPPHPLAPSANPGESYEDIIANYEEQQLAMLRAVSREARQVPDALLEIVADEIGVTVEQLRSNRRGRDEVTARAVVARCCTELGYTNVQIAEALHVTRQAVARMRRERALSAPHVIAVCRRVLERQMSARLATADLSTQVA